MKKVFIGLILLVSAVSHAQLTNADTGIAFISNLSWSQLQDKAKAERKYIFMDCYASWCLPCKKMDKNVYPLKNVGEAFNDKFISVKVQFDTTQKDLDCIKQWYQDASKIKNEFAVRVYPTYLFFAPDGAIVHKAVGVYNPAEFIELASEATNPEKQYYKLLSDYNNGMRDTSRLRTLARLSRTLGDNQHAVKIANDLIIRFSKEDLYSADNRAFLLEFSKAPAAHNIANSFIGTLTRTQIFDKEIIPFIWTFTQSSKDNGFKLFVKYTRQYDRIMQIIDFILPKIDYVITKEELEPSVNFAISNNSEPDWDQLYGSLKKRHNSKNADRLIMAAKIRWFRWKKNWDSLNRNLIQYVEKYGKNFQVFTLNNYAWEIFGHSNDTSQLKIALRWAKRVIKLDPYYPTALDTYANLLYKLGQRAEALLWEERASRLAPDDTGIQQAFQKMKKGEQTWFNN